MRKISLDRLQKIIAVSAIIIGGFWAVYEFYLSEVFFPSLEPATINSEIILDKVGKKGNMNAVKAKISIHNSGSNQANLVSSWYRVWAYKIKENSPDSYANEKIKTGQTRYHKEWKIDKDELVSAGKILWDDTFLDHDEKISTEIIILSPDEYDILEIRTDIDFAKDKEVFDAFIPDIDKLSLEDQKVSLEKGPKTFVVRECNIPGEWESCQKLLDSQQCRKIDNIEKDSDTKNISKHCKIQKNLKNKHGYVHTGTTSQLSFWSSTNDSKID